VFLMSDVPRYIKHQPQGPEGTCARYKVTSLTRKRTPPGPHRRPMPRVLWGFWGAGHFRVSEVTLDRTFPPLTLLTFLALLRQQV